MVVSDCSLFSAKSFFYKSLEHTSPDDILHEKILSSFMQHVTVCDDVGYFNTEEYFLVELYYFS